MSDTPTKKSVYLALRALLNIMRSMEPIIWAIIFSVWVGLGPFAGMLALVVHTVASLTKQYSEQIEDVDEGPIEAISATGATKLQVLWFAIVPQCVIPFLSFTIYRWDINVRMATIIGFVGGGGIGSKLIQYQNKGDYNEVGTYVILITLVVWILDVISARVREALR
jgi:phosphonate transport system permease protein